MALTKDMRREIRIWLVTTDHLEDGLWFRDESDFKVGVNYVAALAADTGVIVLAFILMSNHVHFVLVCTKEEAEEFIREFKRRYSKYYQRKYGISKLLKKNGYDVKLIPHDGESPQRAIAYVQMNCVAANICSHPTQYPWGSGSAFFCASKPKGVRLDSVSARARRRLLHSKTAIPGEWLLGEEGYVLPSSYIHCEYVEDLYRTPKQMDYFLHNSSKAKARLESGEEAFPSFKDQLVLAAVPDLCRTLFMQPDFQALSEPQKTEILKQLRFRFSANVHQLARVVGLSYEETAKLLDTH